MVFRVTLWLFVLSICLYIVYIAVGVFLRIDKSQPYAIIGIIIACVMFASSMWASVWASLKIIRERAE